FSMIRRHPISPLFPYTTLFRSRALVDIESTTNLEKNVGDYLFAHLSALVARSGGQIQRMSAEQNRDNLFAFWGEPVVTLSTHMEDRKSTRLNSSHVAISYAVFC